VDLTNRANNLEREQKGDFPSGTYLAYLSLESMNDRAEKAAVVRNCGSPNGLIMGAAGNLYGTTAYGGASVGDCGSTGCGVVFKLTP
jgi:hypothetical protein